VAQRDTGQMRSTTSGQRNHETCSPTAPAHLPSPMTSHDLYNCLAPVSCWSFSHYTPYITATFVHPHLSSKTYQCRSSTARPRQHEKTTSSGNSRHHPPQMKKHAPYATKTGTPIRKQLSGHIVTTLSTANALSRGSARKMCIVQIHVPTVAQFVSRMLSTRKRQDWPWTCHSSTTQCARSILHDFPLGPVSERRGTL
jgi:hypothetical protein